MMMMMISMIMLKITIIIKTTSRWWDWDALIDYHDYVDDDHLHYYHDDHHHHHCYIDEHHYANVYDILSLSILSPFCQNLTFCDSSWAPEVLYLEEIAILKRFILSDFKHNHL